MAMGWTAETAVSVAVRGQGWGRTHLFPPLILTQLSSHLLGDIGLSLHRVFTDLKNMDTSWLDSLLPPVRLPSIQAIPCAP